MHFPLKSECYEIAKTAKKKSQNFLLAALLCESKNKSTFFSRLCHQREREEKYIFYYYQRSFDNNWISMHATMKTLCYLSSSGCYQSTERKNVNFVVLLLLLRWKTKTEKKIIKTETRTLIINIVDCEATKKRKTPNMCQYEWYKQDNALYWISVLHSRAPIVVLTLTLRGLFCFKRYKYIRSLFRKQPAHIGPVTFIFIFNFFFVSDDDELRVYAFGGLFMPALFIHISLISFSSIYA